VDLAEFDRWLDARNLNGYWNRSAGSTEFGPYHWKSADVAEAVKIAAELVPMNDTGRRVIQMRHPDIGSRMSSTIHMAVQCVVPGEIAKAHRHNAAAIRFIIKGNPDAATVVDGEPFPMAAGDLITTPNWTYHDHYNNGSEPVIWVDGLDVRLVALGKMLGNDYERDRQSQTRPVGFSGRTLGHARPGWATSEPDSPAFRYTWADSYDALLALKESEIEPDPYDGIRLAYTHPRTGGPTLPTFGCNLQLLGSGTKTVPHRHLSTSVYHVVRGEGITTVGDQRFEWATGDFFVVPPWSWHNHEAGGAEDAILFSMDDCPTFTALGLYREEGSQP
jgi:gentisate 1,2-dioxygenase